MDWGPPGGTTSLLDLDLNNIILQNAVKAFSPLKIRMGGTLQDNVVYQTAVDVEQQKACPHFVPNQQHMFQFNRGCLPLSRWDQLNDFFIRTGAVVTFGLNALAGRSINSRGTAVGDWDFTNAKSLMRYTVDKGYKILGWELGNELSGNGIGTRIPASQYALDVSALQSLVDGIYNGFDTKPLVIAPGGFFDTTWFAEFVGSAIESVQVITHHIYNLGPGTDNHIEDKILNPSYLNGEASVFSRLQSIINNSESSAVAWVGEAGGAAQGGRNHVTNAFLMNFCALLWHQLMGTRVLSTTPYGTNELRAYAHCSKQSQGFALLLLNLNGGQEVRVSLSTENGMITSQQSKNNGHGSKFSEQTPRWSSAAGLIPEIGTNAKREEYHFTAENGDLHSQTVLLNGKVLRVSPNGEIPKLEPTILNLLEPVIVAPYSVAFVHIPSIILPTCK
ncbi:Heparanase-like protein [Drosera capensis]